ncbi:MAG TPA: hypothetical protein VFY67_02570 [Pyrinomonadaceae bacterium]|nr:hypothetical protein [Pyrinomonadaceae bacterium]HKP35510.1 hypothetical protein [Pyrinomonadaceae bacterium]
MDLLQLWQNIGQEARDLATAVERLPDECECGDADAHLSGRCACCGGHTHGHHPTDSQDCVEIIRRLRTDLTVLGQDLSVAGPALGASALETQRLELRRGIFLAAADLEAILESFKRLTESVAGFRRECTITRMRTVKRRCVELRDHCDRVNAELLD